MRPIGASGVILAGGDSKRLGGLYKPLVEVGGRPMIHYSLEALRPVSKEVIIVVRGVEKVKRLARFAGPGVRIVQEPETSPKAPLIGLIEGARRAESRAILVAPADTPFVSTRVYEVLSEELSDSNADAAVPIWPNGYIEPLIAAYMREEFLSASLEAASRGDLRISSVLSKLNVRFVPVSRLSSRPGRTFFNVNTGEDLLLALEMFREIEEGVRRP